MKKSTTDRIDAAIESEDWLAARRLLEVQLRDRPDDHWLLTRLSTTYYEERNYAQALLICQKAMSVAPGCPLVRWDYAGALEMTGNEAEAISIWKRFLKAGADSLERDPCSEGRDWNISLINDCRYRLALAFGDRGELQPAVRYIRNYLEGRQSGAGGIYTVSAARKKLEVWRLKMASERQAS